MAFSDDGACTNQTGFDLSRLRRAEIGTHHHISGRYLHAYADEMAWREDRRRVSNGEQYPASSNAALPHPVSREWKGSGSGQSPKGPLAPSNGVCEYSHILVYFKICQGPRFLAMPSKNPHSFNFDDDTELLLREFCEACNDASMQTVVVNALKHFIPVELDANQGIKKKFDEIRGVRSSENIHLIREPGR